MYVCIHIYIYIYVICMYVCMYVCMYIYIYIDNSTSFSNIVLKIRMISQCLSK